MPQVTRHLLFLAAALLCFGVGFLLAVDVFDGDQAPWLFAAEEQDQFVADPSREWPFTWNPGGYLKRVERG